MNDLLIRLYLDEDVSVVIRRMLSSRGYDVVTTRDSGRLRTSDADQLAFATIQARAIVTHNHSDFVELVKEFVASGQHHCIVIAHRRKPAEIASRLLAILDDVTADGMRDQVRYI